MLQRNDDRFIRLIASRMNMCEYRKLPHDLKMMFSSAHKEFEDLAGNGDWDTDKNKALREALFDLAQTLVAKQKHDWKRHVLTSQRELVEQCRREYEGLDS